MPSQAWRHLLKHMERERLASAIKRSILTSLAAYWPELITWPSSSGPFQNKELWSAGFLCWKKSISAHTGDAGAFLTTAGATLVSRRAFHIEYYLTQNRPIPQATPLERLP